MMKHVKIILIASIFAMSACMPIPFEEVDMVTAKQFVNTTKRQDSDRIAPVPEVQSVKPLVLMAGEPFKYEAEPIIDDWREQVLNIRSEGRGQR